jgi:hypothetical protein
VWLALLLLFAVTGSSLILEQVDMRLFKLACLASTLWNKIQVLKIIYPSQICNKVLPVHSD